MKTVTSEGSLSTHMVGMGMGVGVGAMDMQRLNRKIKSIKSALKVAERHNEELHLKLKNQKENHQMEVIQLETEYKKYRELYQALLEKYELRTLELKEYKKRLKRSEVDLQVGEEDEAHFRDTLLRQEKQLIRLKEENRVLYDQLHDKTTRLKDFQGLITKSHLQLRPTDKDRSFLASLKAAIETKNDDYDRLQQQKARLVAGRAEMERETSELALKLAKAQTEADYQRKLSKQAKEKVERLEKEVSRLAEEGRTAAMKYQQLLNFAYEAQRDMEQQLQTIQKEVLRKEHR